MEPPLPKGARVSGGHLCEAEAPTEATAETGTAEWRWRDSTTEESFQKRHTVGASIARPFLRFFASLRMTYYFFCFAFVILRELATEESYNK